MVSRTGRVAGVVGAGRPNASVDANTGGGVEGVPVSVPVGALDGCLLLVVITLMECNADMTVAGIGGPVRSDICGTVCRATR